MIPSNISRKHVEQAIEEIDKTGYPAKRESTKFDLIHHGKRYPPKVVVSKANRFANGEELTQFSGGEETNQFLRRLGFKIVLRESIKTVRKTWIFQGNPSHFEIDRYLSEQTKMYWSVTKNKHIEEIQAGDIVYLWRSRGNRYHSYGIVAKGIISASPVPKSGVNNPELLGDDLWLQTDEKYDSYKAEMVIDEVRLNEQSGMLTVDMIRSDEILSEMSIVKLKVGTNFELTDEQAKHLEAMWSEFRLDENSEEDRQEDLFHISGYTVQEGKRRMKIHKRRERDSKLREMKIKSFMIQHKRLFCEICNFDFEAVYGEIGKGFIEVHHYIPLNKMGEYRMNANEALDNLKIICANCHRMVHRGDPVEMFETIKKLFDIP